MLKKREKAMKLKETTTESSKKRCQPGVKTRDKNYNFFFSDRKDQIPHNSVAGNFFSIPRKSILPVMSFI